MALPQKLLARSVVLFLLLGMLPALQQPATVAAQDTATYTLTKFDCPPGYDPGAHDPSDVFTDCATPAAGVAFTLASGDGAYGSTHTTDGNGATTWRGIPTGVGYSVTESVPGGYLDPWVYCVVMGDPSSPDDVQGSYFRAPGGAMDIGYTDPSLVTYTQATCTWFNQVPANGNGETTDTTTTNAVGQVMVVKYNCPDEADWQNGSYDYVQNQCRMAAENVQFQLRAPNYQVDLYTAANGLATWNDLPGGSYTLFENVPAGYKVGRMFCGVTTDPQTAPSSWDEYTYSGGVELPVAAGQILACVVFDVPSSASVTITKYICEEGDINKTDPEYLDYNGACQEPGSGWSFTLSGGSAPVVQTTGASGSVTFSAAAGSFTLSEEELPGYGSLALYCNDGSNADAWEAVPLTGASGSIDVAEGETLTCQWFNYHYPSTGDLNIGQTITITKYICERFLTRGWPVLSDYQTHCTETAAGVEFVLYAGMQVVDTVSTDNSGIAVLTAPEAGTYQIVETPVDGYIPAAAYCMSSATDDPTQPEDTPVAVDVTDDYPVTCAWYNTEDVWGGAISDPGTVLIHKYECPAGYPDSGTNGFEEILGACTLPGSNVAFSVSQGGSTVASGSTDAAGEVALTGAATGMTRISEFPIEGWEAPRVFCAIVPAGVGRGIAAFDEQAVTTWGVDIDFPADSYVSCYWFNRPPSGGTEGQPIQIIIHKLLCAPGTLPGSTYEGAITECDQKEEGVDFALVGGDGGTASGPTDVNGYAEYNGLAPGTVTITETLRDGYRTGAVFCSAYTSAPGDFDAFPVTNEAISYYLAGGYKLECYWFNIQEPPTGTIYVFKYACDSELSYTSYDDLHYACLEKPDGVPFEVQIGSETWNEPTDASGAALFDQLPETPSGAATISETSPSGYRSYAVFCGYSDYGYIPPTTVEEAPIDAPSGSIEQAVIADKFLMCYWFNAPDQHDPQVWIYKYNCGDDASWHWDYHELLSNCTEPASGVEFGFGPQGSGQSASMTNDQGRWLYDSLSPGVWYWQEYYPTGYSGAIVYCQWVDQHGSGEYQKAELDGSTLWLDLDYGQIVTCYWFDYPESTVSPTPTPHSGSGGSGGSGTPPPPLSSNVPSGGSGGVPAGGTTSQPSDSSAPATLIIVKRTCPAGYDLYADDSNVEQDCPDLTKDIDFALTSLTPNVQNGTPVPSEPIPQTTGEDGKATWENLAAGPYLLVESMPEDTHAAFIWTCSSDKRQFQLEYPLTPFSYAGPDGETGITLIPGETLECAWYDVPSAPGTITIFTFACPGTPVIVAQCQPAGAGLALTLAPIDAVGPVLSLTTDENGTAGGEGVGVYSITEEGATPCLIDSAAIDAQGHLVIGESDEIEVKIYNCGNGS